MKSESQIAGVLSHLAWLEAGLRDSTDQRHTSPEETTLLAYNAAVMLQWRFTCPLSYADEIQNPEDYATVTTAIQKLVGSSRRAVADLAGTKGKDVAGILQALRLEISAALASLPPLFRFAKPKAVRLSQLERNPDIPLLIREYLDEQEAGAADVASLPGTDETPRDAGPDAAIHDALAMLAYLTSGRAQTDGGTPETHRALLRMAKGFLKTAVDFRIEEQDSQGIQPLKALADAMVADAAGAP